VRVDAIAALGQIEPKPADVIPTLGDQLKSQTASPAARRAAAQALADLVFVATVVSKKPMGVLEAAQVKQQLVHTAAMAVTHCVPGLESPDVEVRRLCASTCRLASTAAVELIALPYPANTFPPAERKGLTDDEKKAIADAQKSVTGISAQLSLLTKPFEEGMKVLTGVAAHDPDLAARIEARRILEELGIARQRLARLVASVPPLTEGEAKPEARRDPGAPNEPAAFPGVAVLHPVEPGLALRRAPVALNRAVAFEEPEPADQPPADQLSRSLRDAAGKLGKQIEPGRETSVEAKLAAIDALEGLGDDAAPALPSLIRALSDPNKYVRWSATRVIARLASREADAAVPRLAELIAEHSDLDVRMAALAALERYGPATKDLDTAVRAAVVREVGNAAMRGDPEARIAAMKVLQVIGADSAPALPAVARNLTGFYNRGLPRPGEEAAAYRGATVQPEDNVRLRQAACETLGRIGVLAPEADKKHVVSLLRRAMGDPDTDVRRAASDALLKVLGK
jgi:HEAT repeat protein